LFCKLDHEEIHVPKAKTNTKKTAGKPKKKDAGAKLTKAFRNFGPIKELMNSSLGREVLADVLIAAAGAAAAALTKNRGAKADLARDAVQTAAGAVASVVTDAARNFLPTSLLAEDERPAPARAKTAGRAPARKTKAGDASTEPKKRKAPARKAASAPAAATAPKIAET
jgi:hypothetical protein